VSVIVFRPSIASISVRRKISAEFRTHGGIGVCSNMTAVNISAVKVLCLPPETNRDHLNVALSNLGGKLIESYFSLFVV
jgi:hypothetical protein